MRTQHTLQNDLAILGIAAGVSLDIVKRTFRKLALKYHPDKGGDVKSFVLVQQAYERITAYGQTTPRPEHIRAMQQVINVRVNVWVNMGTTTASTTSGTW